MGWLWTDELAGRPRRFWPIPNPDVASSACARAISAGGRYGAVDICASPFWWDAAAADDEAHAAAVLTLGARNPSTYAFNCPTRHIDLASRSLVAALARARAVHTSSCSPRASRTRTQSFKSPRTELIATRFSIIKSDVHRRGLARLNRLQPWYTPNGAPYT